jgi:hypothetical protein
MDHIKMEKYLSFFRAAADLYVEKQTRFPQYMGLNNFHINQTNFSEHLVNKFSAPGDRSSE